jgi:hypothetical protein
MQQGMQDRGTGRYSIKGAATSSNVRQHYSSARLGFGEFKSACQILANFNPSSLKFGTVRTCVRFYVRT